MALGLFILGASALSGIGTGLGLYGSRQQQKMEQAQYAYEAESARLEAAESAYEATRQFRQAIGTTIAMGGARGGNLALEQFTMESLSNYLQDQKAIAKAGKRQALAYNIKAVESRSQRRARDINLALGFGSNMIDLVNLNTMGTSKKK